MIGKHHPGFPNCSFGTRRGGGNGRMIGLGKRRRDAVRKSGRDGDCKGEVCVSTYRLNLESQAEQSGGKTLCYASYKCRRARKVPAGRDGQAWDLESDALPRIVPGGLYDPCLGIGVIPGRGFGGVPREMTRRQLLSRSWLREMVETKEERYTTARF